MHCLDNNTWNKQPMGCEAQLAWKCLFTPTFSAGDCDQ